MATIITYDIPSKHMEFKAAMFKLGYKAQIPGKKCKIIYLPNTTLYHATKDADTTMQDAKDVCKVLQVDLERCVATQWGPDYQAICGEPFKS